MQGAAGSGEKGGSSGMEGGSSSSKSVARSVHLIDYDRFSPVTYINFEESQNVVFLMYPIHLFLQKKGFGALSRRTFLFGINEYGPNYLGNIVRCSIEHIFILLRHHCKGQLSVMFCQFFQFIL